MCTGAGVLAVTQEQLAQYVAAQQTGHKQQSVSVVPRARQAYALQSAEDAGESAYQQAYQAAYQQAAAAYQPQAAAAYQPQAAPQATSYKSFSSSVGVGKDYQPVYYRPAPGVPQYHDPAQLQPLRKLRPLPGAPDKEPEEDYDVSICSVYLHVKQPVYTHHAACNLHGALVIKPYGSDR
ncbi:hypothetical protein J6590_016853 [Homalodisca vitripennis]|nr:hypothetical protein J6590_016853 [Homalodisca vitripennis]